MNFSATTGSAEPALVWVRLIQAVIAFIPVCLFVFWWWILAYAAALVLAWKKIPALVVTDGEYVKRPHIESAFVAALQSENSETVLIYGPRGSGKTSFIRSALRDRQAVLAIDVTKKNADEAADQLREKLSESVPLAKNQSDLFILKVFSLCRATPVVVVSMEEECTGEALRAVLAVCKSISYNQPGQSVRTVVEISSSRSVIDGSIQIKKLRVIGVEVGHLAPAEAEYYTTKRMPTSLKDPLRRDDIARKIVNLFDGHVLTLQDICSTIRKGAPTDVNEVDKMIMTYKNKLEAEALTGWAVFVSSLEKLLKEDFEPESIKATAQLLLDGGPHDSNAVATNLSGKHVVSLTVKEIFTCNAAASVHPLSIDPFDTTTRISGKALMVALKKKYA